MATGSITSLGLGSGLDLQNILDKLKQADRQVIDRKENEKNELTKELNAYNSINAKLFSMKSSALGLSLESNFMETSSTVSDESVISATVNEGMSDSAYSIDVTQKAQRNSWESAAFDSGSDIMFSQPDTGIAGTDETVVTADETMSIDYGESGDQQQIDVNLTNGMTLSDVADAVNSSADNQDTEGNTLVNASIEQNENNEYYIRLSAASDGNSADSEITVSGYDYVAPDTTVSLAQGDKTMYLNVKAGSTYEDVETLINESSDNPGISASIIDNGNPDSPYQFTLTADETGEANRIDMTNLTLNEVTGSGGESLNSAFKVNGIAYERQSNTGISDVIDGITLDLKKPGHSTINLMQDKEPVKEKIISLVEGYNKLAAEISGESSEEETQTDTDSRDDAEGPLENSSSMKRMASNLKSLLTTVVNNDSKFSSLSDLGLEAHRDGTLSIDEAKLDQAFASDPDAATSLFMGDTEKEIKGLGDIINDGIGNMVSSSGIVPTEIDATEDQMERLAKDIETATDRLDKRYETMTQEFVRLDGYMRQLQSEESTMQSMFDSFNQNKDK
ncbi:MAG: flagellar filament capping protein FliD [Desulfobacteraceae bacterium]